MTGCRLEFRILGPLEVWADGLPVPIGGPRQRALLAILLLSANRVVSRDRLVEELLPDKPGAAGERSLKVQVSRLRKALGSAGGERLVARAPGYVLRVEPGELDLECFEQSLAEGRQAFEEGDAERASGLLSSGLSLWRGRPLADLEFEPFARVEVERLEELRLAAVEERIEAELAGGRHAVLVPELEGLVEEHPLRERLRGQLMIALYRAGRQAEALETYRTGRALLSEELALEPGPQLRELEQAILRHDGSLVVIEHDRQRPAPANNGTVIAPTMPRPRRRSGAVAGAVVAVAAAVVAVAVYVDRTSSPAVVLPHGDAIALLGPRGAIEGALPLASAPEAAVAGFGSIWVSEVNADRVVRIDPERRTVVQTIQVGRGPGAIAAGAGDVWVANSVDGTVSRIDPGTDSVVQTIRVGSDPSGVAVAEGRVLVASHGDGAVDALDATTGRVRRSFGRGEGPSDVVTAGGSVWVADDVAGTVGRLDPSTGAVDELVHVGDAPTTLVASAADLWVLDRLDSTISHIDSTTDSVVSTTPLPGDPKAVVPDAGGAWVADGSTGRLLRVDGKTGAVVQTIDLHRRCVALASGRAGVWVAFAGAGATHRGGTLRVVSTSPAVDSLDPAASNSPNSGNVFNLTNDGLVTLDHTAGADGTRLVPDLAISLPRPANGGLAYTFRLRPGIRYSSGRTVRPSDVRRSFERMFELGSAGTAYFAAITGAGACSNRHCNLAAGIAVDDQAGTVTFHLSHPDPDFLYKLTLPYADVLPDATATHARSIVSTGPYEVGRYVAGHRLTLVRNPRFRQWSAAAQPAGYPDRITVRLGTTASAAAADVAEGRADLVSSLGVLPPTERTFFLIGHPSRIQINPTLGTNFLFLNVKVPPFDDVRVRRALNFALDRTQIVAADGGRSAAEPACQILPPQLPGYEPYCPYTVHARPNGVWRGPDLARARRLVAASRTGGMRVEVWDTFGPPVFLREGQATVTALRELGYRASLRLLPDSKYFAYTNDSRNRAQVIDGGWSVAYPSADNLIGKLTCRYFTPGSGARTTDAGELCDHPFDRQVGRAAMLQATDAPAADRLWARLDRRLTDRAVWLPTVTPNEIDLLSGRVANYQYNPVLGALIDQLWVR